MKDLSASLTWIAVVVVAFLGVAEATWQTAGAGEATAGTAGSGATDDQFTASLVVGGGWKGVMAVKFRCNPCPVCVSPNRPQVTYEYTVMWYNGNTLLGTTSALGAHHECRCPTSIIPVSSGTLIAKPTRAEFRPTVSCRCCDGTTPVWTSDDAEAFGNLVPGLIDLDAAN